MESTLLQDYFLLRPENLLFVVAALMSGGMLLWSTISGRSAKEIDTRTAIQLINYKDALVLDVRDDSEYADGHLPNSKHIPTEKIAERWHELEKFKDKPIVVIFRSGVRSGHASSVLFKNGFVQVHNLMGGIDAWRRANLPIVKR
ncbi:Rhodanese-related sulfurtransferase [Nitrosomonas cryotolerans]|uniref:Rhodanese-related sulfurtransferase n=1 Tax=Nitrosomonas cryotolerans ATCC 49181 TaxID=1131553 RepID=A0A1N6FNK4_9PROT|nr:rhodanese-like domain-containing protein [Nitrosomonas cryotolerans]SFP78479.1 Rhodanese-related sulfurtransferase [Nitrosomonas cryotolerans]SIN96828.1 Rhodanese-related sulfurtransferase [Nitrosomonas cryotolerans ATCC 49181]